MPHDLRFWVPWSTAEDLLRAAAHQGTPTTKRLITDWTERGLLDRPRSRGQGQGPGREKGVWRWEQRRLFLALLQKRPAKRSAFLGLFNLPVFMWLWWGEPYVNLSQAHRALLSWTSGLSKTTEKDARRAARRMLRQLAHRDASRGDRRMLEDHLQVWAIERNVYPGELRRLLRPVIDPHGTGEPRGPSGAQFDTESYLALVEARLVGEIHLAEFSDAEFEQARAVYRNSRRGYGKRWRQWSRDPDVGHMFDEPTVSEIANNACLDLTVTLGLEKRGGAPQTV